MGRRPLVKVGDVIQIPLSDGRRAYCQFVFEDKENGDIIRVFDFFTKESEILDLKEIDISKLLFLPVYASIYWAVKDRGWKVIGSLPVDDYKFTGFLYDLPAFPPNPNGGGRVKSWSLWDGEKYVELGEILPKEYQKYESVGVNPAGMIVDRIETGFDSLEYPKKYNRYITRDELKRKYPSIKI